MIAIKAAFQTLHMFNIDNIFVFTSMQPSQHSHINKGYVFTFFVFMNSSLGLEMNIGLDALVRLVSCDLVAMDSFLLK